MDGKEFRHIRHITGLTKTRYSQSFGFSLAKITAYESGKRSITPEDAAYAEKIRDTFKENYERAETYQH